MLASGGVFFQGERWPRDQTQLEKGMIERSRLPLTHVDDGSPPHSTNLCSKTLSLAIRTTGSEPHTAQHSLHSLVAVHSTATKIIERGVHGRGSRGPEFTPKPGRYGQSYARANTGGNRGRSATCTRVASRQFERLYIHTGLGLEIDRCTITHTPLTREKQLPTSAETRPR